MSGIRKRLDRLREEMREAGIDVYIVPSSDCHESEYVCAHYRARTYITGFTGSAGTAAVTMDDAVLWTDGRYFLQAERELQGSGVRLFRMGEPGVPTIEQYIEERLPEGGTLGFDGSVMGAARADRLARAAEKRNGALLTSEDLVGRIWENRPEIPDAPVWILEERYAGESVEHKLQRVRAEMAKARADIHVIASLCDIAWLLNLRGGDIPCVPVVLSFLTVTQETCTWYVRGQIVTEELRRYLDKKQVALRPYEAIYGDLLMLPAGKRVLMDRKNVNFRLTASLPKGVVLLNRSNPSEHMKAVKNETELRNIREAHRKEGLAFTRFMYWVKTRVGKEPIDELSASAYLAARRMEQEHCIEESFAPICAYGEHAAIVHYSATKESSAPLGPEGFLLVDAGGHYLEGTTDTTRTFALGALTGEQKRMFTAVCRGNLRLAHARFLYGCSGGNLDALCREPLWELGVDYKHGTGHGVGYLLNVHEGPNMIRWKQGAQERPAALAAGMVTTDEPGVYFAGRYGIRTENELLCVQGEQNEYGQFMEFEILTLTPIDLDAILPEEMSETERGWLNAYHRRVYRELAPYLSEEERAWLSEYTKAV